MHVQDPFVNILSTLQHESRTHHIVLAILCHVIPAIPFPALVIQNQMSVCGYFRLKFVWTFSIRLFKAVISLILRLKLHLEYRLSECIQVEVPDEEVVFARHRIGTVAINS